jgi:hypothetical protein
VTKVDAVVCWCGARAVKTKDVEFRRQAVWTAQEGEDEKQPVAETVEKITASIFKITKHAQGDATYSPREHSELCARHHARKETGRWGFPQRQQWPMLWSAAPAARHPRTCP